MNFRRETALIARQVTSIIILALVGTIISPSYAQTHVESCFNNPRVTLEDLKIDILLESTMRDPSYLIFKVSFLDSGTPNKHKDIDWGFTISDQNGTEIFNAVPSGKSSLHSTEGEVTIPYHFTKTGNYSVNVIVYGVNFTPTIPHVTTFPCNDIPEFPVGLLGLVAALMGTLIVVTRMKKLWV